MTYIHRKISITVLVLLLSLVVVSKPPSSGIIKPPQEEFSLEAPERGQILSGEATLKVTTKKNVDRVKFYWKNESSDWKHISTVSNTSEGKTKEFNLQFNTSTTPDSRNISFGALGEKCFLWFCHKIDEDSVANITVDNTPPEVDGWPQLRIKNLGKNADVKIRLRIKDQTTEIERVSPEVLNQTGETYLVDVSDSLNSSKTINFTDKARNIGKYIINFTVKDHEIKAGKANESQQTYWKKSQATNHGWRNNSLHYYIIREQPSRYQEMLGSEEKIGTLNPGQTHNFTTGWRGDWIDKTGEEWTQNHSYVSTPNKTHFTGKITWTGSPELPATTDFDYSLENFTIHECKEPRVIKNQKGTVNKLKEGNTSHKKVLATAGCIEKPNLSTWKPVENYNHSLDSQYVTASYRGIENLFSDPLNVTYRLKNSSLPRGFQCNTSSRDTCQVTINTSPYDSSEARFYLEDNQIKINESTWSQDSSPEAVNNLSAITFNGEIHLTQESSIEFQNVSYKLTTPDISGNCTYSKYINETQKGQIDHFPPQGTDIKVKVGADCVEAKFIGWKEDSEKNHTVDKQYLASKHVNITNLYTDALKIQVNPPYIPEEFNNASNSSKLQKTMEISVNNSKTAEYYLEGDTIQEDTEPVNNHIYKEKDPFIEANDTQITLKGQLKINSGLNTSFTDVTYNWTPEEIQTDFNTSKTNFKFNITNKTTLNPIYQLNTEITTTAEPGEKEVEISELKVNEEKITPTVNFKLRKGEWNNITLYKDEGTGEYTEIDFNSNSTHFWRKEDTLDYLKYKVTFEQLEENNTGQSGSEETPNGSTDNSDTEDTSTNENTNTSTNTTTNTSANTSTTTSEDEFLNQSLLTPSAPSSGVIANSHSQIPLTGSFLGLNTDRLTPSLLAGLFVLLIGGAVVLVLGMEPEEENIKDLKGL